ncbi:hypothetical protein Q4I30_003265 [Leishmania utingensis]|uniref:Uncharacterized protein n=1 Tax=Leishmania utingensis TaxID=653362 RepID=A0AAW3AP64_9TRYP
MPLEDSAGWCVQGTRSAATCAPLRSLGPRCELFAGMKDPPRNWRTALLLIHGMNVPCRGKPCLCSAHRECSAATEPAAPLVADAMASVSAPATARSPTGNVAHGLTKHFRQMTQECCAWQLLPQLGTADPRCCGGDLGL